MPSAETYRRRYGSLMAAYNLIGYQPEPRRRFAETAARVRSKLKNVAFEIVVTIERMGKRAEIDQSSGFIVINDEFSVSLHPAHAISSGPGRVRWRVPTNRNAASDLTLVIRMDSSNTNILAYYLLPTAELARANAKHLSISSRIFLEACRFDSLDAFCRMCIPNPTLDQLRIERPEPSAFQVGRGAGHLKTHGISRKVSREFKGWNQ
jgi:hypothetical protein